MKLLEALGMAINPNNAMEVLEVKEVLHCRGCGKYYLPDNTEIGKQYAEDYCTIVHRYCGSVCMYNHLKN